MLLLHVEHGIRLGLKTAGIVMGSTTGEGEPSYVATSAGFGDATGSGRVPTGPSSGIGTWIAAPHLGHLVVRPAALSGAVNRLWHDAQAVGIGIAGPGVEFVSCWLPVVPY